MMFENKGIQLTIKLDDNQVKSVTALIMDYMTKRFENYDSDLEDIESDMKELRNRIERLSK